ncbi:MAG: RsmG family class I SAM-dependent methyltransferase [Isosphaeraceae bacterium]
MTPSRRSLQILIEQCGIRLEAGQYDQLWAYHGMLRAANPDLNLTRIHNFENMVLKHYVDSLLILQFEDLPSPLIDMGSGPGLPGIPLKIARPDVEMILAEPRGARSAVSRGGLSQTGVDRRRGSCREDQLKYVRPVRGVITRAVASIPETLDRVAGCLQPGGRMLLMKGPECDSEIVEARETHRGSFRLVADHAYTIPGTTHDRRLVVYERLDAPVERAGETPAERYAGAIREVTSDSNPTYKLCRDVLTGRGIRKHGQALLAGPRQVAEVLEQFPERVEAWVTGATGPPPPEVTPPGLTWIRLSDALFRELDTSGTHAPLALVRVPDMPDFESEAVWPEGCTLFVPFQDPENVGAVIRSAAAFGVARVVLLKGAAHPFHPRSVRAAGPALFQVPLLNGPAIDELHSNQAELIALATDGEPLAATPFPDRFGLVPGVEGPGLPEAFRQGPRRRIPIAPGVESLNAATATAIALYAWSQARPGTHP